MKPLNSFGNMSRMLLLPVVLMLLADQVSAKTNVAEKIEQMKTNVESSKVNLKEYEDNLVVVQKNITETSKAVSALEKRKQNLSKQSQDIAKGKSGLDSTKVQIQGHLQNERQKLDSEKKQIEELKRTLATLEDNQLRRQANISMYEEKLKSVDTEKITIEQRNQSMAELEKAIQEKLSQAQADQRQMRERESGYLKEIARWKKEVRVSERNYENFKNLQD